MSAASQLVEVKRLPELAALRLTWDDGFSAEPSYRVLAGLCPCAGCQGHGGKIVFREPREGIEPHSIQPVGNYAISIVWEGGCRTGIYTFEYLRELSSADRVG